MNTYGHTHLDFPNDPTHWEPLPQHLADVARRAADFAQGFGCADFAHALGRWHDFGKFSVEFQQYLKDSNGDTEEGDGPTKHRRGPDHSTAGARHAVADPKYAGLGHLLAYAIAGHHAGLADGIVGNPGVAQESTLEYRLKHTTLAAWEAATRAALPVEWFKAPMPDKAHGKFLADGYAASFWTRMLFSCLVDADFLATESFMDAKRAEMRDKRPIPTLAELEAKLTAFMDDKAASIAAAGLADTPVNRIRAEVRTACLDAATHAPGLFSLTVPTGGGKTFASLAFALKHARAHGLERIIYVIPFTSIIEQNAGEFRKALGDDAVLEHHSNFVNEPDDHATPAERERAWQTKLAAENWDAPLIVTTAVQFFESLHAHKPSRCRKLHNLAKAVIILDEAQTLPVPLLQPCLRALEQLAQNYGSTVILCTATQPAIHRRENFACGLTGIREIIPPALALHDRLRRVTVVRIREKLTDDALAARLAAEPGVLAIVNTRRHARELFEKLRVAVGETAATAPAERTVYHLSAQMCPVHRTEILDTVRARLKSGQPVRLVSTQLIEAGVDVDFPCVYRTLAGLDAIAQAAGRCNREGRLATGRVFVFESADHKIPAGFLRETADKGREVLDLPEFSTDPLSPSAIEKYFGLLYWQNYAADETRDRTNFVRIGGANGAKTPVVGGLIPKTSPLRVPVESRADAACTFSFRTLGENFRLIEDTAESVLIPYDDHATALINELRTAYAPGERRRLARQLQRYAVAIPKPVFAAAVATGRVVKLHESFAILEVAKLADSAGLTNYSADFGVALGDRDGAAGLLAI